VKYLKCAGIQHVCGPIDCLNTVADGSASAVSANCIVKSNVLILVVFEWAIGTELNFLEYRWMLDETVVRTVGCWLANCHSVSRQFSIEHPAIATRIQRWDQIHESLLAGSDIHPDDRIASEDVAEFGVIHGDFNCSNYFYDDASGNLSVFDWDQTHRGWYMWDVAQACFTVVMLAEAGLPLAGTPVPEASPDQFFGWIISGYESVAGGGSVDKARLSRMVHLKRHFYEKFCRQAQVEGDIPPDMKGFIDYIVAWFDKNR
jgi:Ser/Thr protein kinase RdoA (MazF antagonist)